MNAATDPPQGPPLDHRPMGSSSRQQLGLLTLLVLAVIYASVRYWRNPEYVSNPQPLTPSRAGDLADKIDPNVAGAEALSALPQVGDKRARDLIAYRERAKQNRADGVVFRRTLDLLRVPRFGISLANHMEPYLAFPATAPTTMPGD